MIVVGVRARVGNLDAKRRIAIARGSMFVGKAQHRDTYFDARAGYLKVRESDMDQDRLLFYRRDRRGDLATCESWSTPIDPVDSMRALLEAALDVRGSVEKTRETFERQNMIIELDRVRPNRMFLGLKYQLGPGEIPDDATQELRDFMRDFEVTKDDLVTESYCEMRRA